jgi:hypothetical protein
MNFTGQYGEYLNYITTEQLEWADREDVLNNLISIQEQEISILQTKLDEVNARWYNRLHVFITTLRLRNPFYNQS